MAPPTPQQLALRRRIERAIALAAPALDLLLLAGDRLSRIVDSDPPLDPATRPLTAADSRRVTHIGR